MDVDAMSIEHRNELMKKGACFKCEEPGHLAKDCKNGYKNKGRTQNSYQTKRTSPKEVAALLAAMTEEERDECFDFAEKQDF